MNAYKVDAIVTEGGLTILEQIPLAVGMSVEVIILDHSVSGGKLDSNTERADYIVGISSLMTEWESPADESAYDESTW